jgi:hypothetical protein
MSSIFSEQKLKTEIQELKKKLKTAKIWMQREVTKQTQCIISEKSHWETHLFSPDFEVQISQQIYNLFWEVFVMEISETIMENLITSEVEYCLLQKWYQIEPLSVIISYQKILDFWIEKYITVGFRRFAKAAWKTDFWDNHHLENTFDNIMDQNYILWVNKFFTSLLLIASGEYLPSGVSCFAQYLKSIPSLWEILSNREFLSMCASLLESDVFGSKRHSGEILLSEIEQVRGLVAGNLKDKNCLLYKLFETQKIDI